MGFISDIFAGNQSDLQNPRRWFVDLVTGRKSSSGINVSHSSSMTLSAYYACIRNISEDIGKLPFKVYRSLQSGGKEKARNNPIFNLLFNAPNNEMTPMTFKEVLTAHALGWGNGYAEIVRNGAGQPVSLFPIHPQAVTVERNNAGDIEYKIFKSGFLSLNKNEEIIIPARDMIHLKGLGGDGLVGYSVLKFASESIGSAIATQEYAGAFFGNGTQLGGILEHPQVMSKEAQDRFLQSWNQRHAGSKNAHKTAILEEGMKWTSTTVPPKDAQFIEVKKFQVVDIARWFRMPPHKIESLDFATFCLPCDELIFTENGAKKIIDIKKGDKVWSKNKDNKLELAKVKHSICTGIDEILELKTTNRTIRCNAKHPILCRVKKYEKQLAGVLGGQCIAGEMKTVKWSNEYIPAGKIKIDDTIISLKQLPDSGVLENCPTRIPTIGFMEFLGLLIGDGNVFDYSINIARANNASYMDYYREIIKNEFVNFGRTGNGKTRENLRKIPVKLIEGDRQTRFNSVLACEELKTLGMKGTAKTKSVPDWIFKIPRMYQLAFLRGFLDSDGSVDKKGRISFGSSNYNMLNQMRHLCIGCGVSVTNVTTSKGITTLPNGKRKAFIFHAFTCSNPEDNKRIGSRTPKYIARIENGKPFKKKSRNYPRYGGKDFDENSLELSRIVKINIQKKEPVYDLEIEKNHSFIANGIIVHNSNIEQQALEYVGDALMPWIIRWEEEINRKLLSNSELFSKLSVQALLRGDSKTRSEYYRTQLNIGALSINEIREFEDMNPIAKGGDEHFMQLNMTTIKNITSNNQNMKNNNMRAEFKSEIIASMEPILSRTIKRINAKERKAIDRALSKKDFNFDEWAGDFFSEQFIFANNSIEPILFSISNVLKLSEPEINNLKKDMYGFLVDYYKIRESETIKNKSGSVSDKQFITSILKKIDESIEVKNEK